MKEKKQKLFSQKRHHNKGVPISTWHFDFFFSIFFLRFSGKTEKWERKMKVLSLFALLFLVFFNLTSCHDHDEEEDDHDTDLDDPELQWVTCGSIITLINSETGLRLHSHDVSYGTGSGQQSVTCFDGQSDSNNYWIVRAQHGDYCNRKSFFFLKKKTKQVSGFFFF